MNQTYDDFDIIIYDDNSNDFLQSNSTFLSLKKLHEGLNHNIEIIKGVNKGPQYGGQQILESSKTEYIFRLDDDVTLQPECIENLINHFDDHYNIVAVGPIYILPFNPISDQIIDLEKIPDYVGTLAEGYGGVYVNGILQMNVHLNADLIKKYQIQHLHSGFMYKKAALEKIGGYFLGYSKVGHREETDTSYRLFLDGGKLVIAQNAICFHFHPMTGGIRTDNGKINDNSLWENDEKIFVERFRNNFKTIVPLIEANVVNKNRRIYTEPLQITDPDLDARKFTAMSARAIEESKSIPFEKKLIQDLSDAVAKQIDDEIMSSYQPKIHLVTVTHGNHEKLNKLIESINKYTNTIFSWTIVNNDTSNESYSSLLELLEHHQMNIAHIQVDEELSVSEARNQGAKLRPEDTEYICFIDDDALILGKWSEKDWLRQLYELFISEKDIGAVSPIYTWFEPFQSYVASVACLFTSTKVWEQVGGFDPIFGNKEQGTWGWEDNDWSYRVQSLGYKLKRINDEGFPFYHEDTTFKEKAEWQEKGLIKGKELLLSKYNIDDINKFKRVLYPFTDNQMNCFGKKLNIGCYHMKLDGFINIDINPECEPDILGDIRELEFENESIELILASQVLEHFDLVDVKFLLSKFYKWLKHNSHLIIEVPDVGTILDMVEKGECKIEDHQGAIYGNKEILGQAHKSQFDETLLINMLKEAGFSNMIKNPITSDGDISLRFDIWKD